MSDTEKKKETVKASIKQLRVMEQDVWSLLLDNVIDGSNENDPKLRYEFNLRIDEDVVLLNDIMELTAEITPVDPKIGEIYERLDYDFNDIPELYYSNGHNELRPIKNWEIDFYDLSILMYYRGFDLKKDFIEHGDPALTSAYKKYKQSEEWGG